MADRGARRWRTFGAAALLSLALVVVGTSHAQTAYKYRGAEGEWIYSDRPPPDGSLVEVRELGQIETEGNIRVAYNVVDRRVQLVASNRFYIPVELKLRIEEIRGLELPDAEDELYWIVPPRSERMLVDLGFLGDGEAPYIGYNVSFHPGDPDAQHQPTQPYRAPFAVAMDFPVTQAFPAAVTHTSPENLHAVDVAMPIGTDIFAARGGIVFDVASGYFEAGLDPRTDGPRANVVQILHDDGTFAVYAHLNTNTVRVRPGDRVRRGQYIADSGNTGYSNGPHLHFAVLRNVGMRAESVPVTFEGARKERVTPATGMTLTAY